ncbi:methyltransferase LaeA [Poronia punctata]|nr:methyltransferase LaeA [Poronia punctata]
MAFNGPPNQAIDQPDDRTTPDWWHRWYTSRWGRFYGTYRPGRYLLPCDNLEDDRLDIMHKFHLVARHHETGRLKGLVSKPLPEHPKVLDLGCGTGIWAIELADRLGGTGDYQIEGWDLNMNQPEAIPPGVSFRRFDVEEPWEYTEWSSYDLIHMRSLNGSIEDYPRLYGQIFQHLKPGSGLLEQVEIDFRPFAEGDPRPLQESKHMEWSQKLHQGFARAGKKLEMNPKTKEILEEVGFVDVEHTTIRIPFSPWPPEEEEKEIARWFNLGLTQGIDAITFEPIIHWLNYPYEAVCDLIKAVKADICKRQWRTYCTMHIYVARRPPLVPRRA